MLATDSGSSDPFYIVSYYIKWVTTSWTHSISLLTNAVAHGLVLLKARSAGTCRLNKSNIFLDINVVVVYHLVITESVNELLKKCCNKYYE